MDRFIAGLVAFLASSVVFAGSITLSWTLPIENENGTPLTDLAGVRIYLMVHDTEDPTVTSWVHEDLPPGDYLYVSTAYNSQDVESMFSNTAEKIVEDLKAPVGATVYQSVSIQDGFWLLPVGTIETEVACNINQSVNGKYAVPLSAVDFSGTTQPLVVLADCE